MAKVLFCVAVLLCLCVLVQCKFIRGDGTVNNRPIVGILTQPIGEETRKRYNIQKEESYIAASYVKYVESGGARVVPVFHNSTPAELDTVFNSINALLLPGGGSDLDDTPLYYAGLHLYNRALQANDQGDYFPIVGHCMGFEFLAILTSQDMSILSGVDAENITLALNLTPEAKQSRWLGDAPANIINILTQHPVTLNNHVQCVTPSDFAANRYLPSFYRVLSTNTDRKGKEFISTWEGIKYPFYGAQWHAEKVQFEWNANEAINHSPNAVLAMQYFQNYLVNEARKNSHHYASPQDEYNALIYNYQPIYSEKQDPDFEQIYVF